MTGVFDILAQAPDHQISGAWVLELVKVLVVALGGLFVGKKISDAQAAKVKLDEPVPTVPTRKVAGFVTWDSLAPIVQRMDRLERHLDEVRKEQGEQYKEILEAGSNREGRLIDKIDDVARAIHARIDTQLPRRRTGG